MFQYFKGADNKLCFLTCLLFKLSRSYQGGANSFFRWPGACSRATLTCRDRRQQKVFLFSPDIIDGDGFIVIVFSFLRAILDILEKQESWVIQELR